jgi:hypothetical protein
MSSEIEPTEENTAPDVDTALEQLTAATSATATVVESAPVDEVAVDTAKQDDVQAQPEEAAADQSVPTDEGQPEPEAAVQEQAPVEQPTPVVEQPVVQDAAPAVTAQATEDKSVAVAPAAAPVAPVLDITPTIQTDAGTSYAFQDFVDKIAKEGSTHSQIISNVLQNYIEVMKPGAPVDAATGGRQQVILWRGLLNMINRAGQDFNEAFNVVLAYFREHGSEKKVLGEHYVCRFANSMQQLSKEELDSFWLLLNLLRTIVRSNTRAEALRQIDLGRTITSVYTEEGRARLTQFITG